MVAKIRIPFLLASSLRESTTPPPLLDRLSTARSLNSRCASGFIWRESLQKDDLDLANWDIIKKKFLKTYEPKYSAQTTWANFADLTQKSGKSINDYHVCVQMAYK